MGLLVGSADSAWLVLCTAIGGRTVKSVRVLPAGDLLDQRLTGALRYQRHVTKLRAIPGMHSSGATTITASCSGPSPDATDRTPDTITRRFTPVLVDLGRGAEDPARMTLRQAYATVLAWTPVSTRMWSRIASASSNMVTIHLWRFHPPMPPCGTDGGAEKVACVIFGVQLALAAG